MFESLEDEARLGHYKGDEMPSNKVEKTQNLRRSNAAGKHLDKRSKRARTRGAAKAKAMKEQG